MKLLLDLIAKNGIVLPSNMVKYSYFDIQGGELVNVYSGGAAAAAAAVAAAYKRKLDEEEERLTPYTKEDLTQGWEFKIVRSNTSISSERFSRLCAEESQTGWELVEKFGISSEFYDERFAVIKLIG